MEDKDMTGKVIIRSGMFLVLLVILGLALVTPTPSWAGPMGRGGGNWGGGANLTPEQASQVFDLKQKFSTTLRSCANR
jgi:hypothetical protein